MRPDIDNFVSIFSGCRFSVDGLVCRFGWPATERLAENREDFGLVHQQILFAIDFDVFASVAGEENMIANLDLQLRAAAVCLASGTHVAIATK